MKVRMLNLVVVVVALFALSSAAFAQGVIYGPSTQGRRSPEAMKAAAAAPKPAYDPKDFSGVWWGRNNSLLMKNPLPGFTPEGKKAFDANKPSAGPRAVVPALGNDPIGRCDPVGFPRNLWLNTRSSEFVQTPAKIVQIFEWTHATREIIMDGKLPEDPDPRWYGYAVGHWDGNTLVVNSKGYDERTWLDSLGNPHSEEMELEERWTHPDAETLTVTMTLKDPKYYQQPWVGGVQTFKLQLPKNVTVLEEAYCVPSEEESFNANTRNVAGTGKKDAPADLRNQIKQ
jgi:hypothetical protein